MLNKAFVEKYSKLQPNFGPIGEVVYSRTYSRPIQELSRREYWHETVERVVNFSASLAPISQEEAEDLYDRIWSMKMFPAGRTLWAGGTGMSSSQFNCSFLVLKEAQDFYDLTYMLMSGAGVGFRVDSVDDLNKNIPINSSAKLTNILYDYVGAAGVLENTFVELDEKNGKTATIVIGDSREGWADAIKIYLGLLGNSQIKEILVNYNYVRPLGTPLKRFGGYASGPEPLIDFFTLTHKFLVENDKGWTSLKALDVANLIGRTVVSGGSRRSAQIGLSVSSDHAFAEAKTGTWYESAPWRSQSNNTIIFKQRPSKEELKQRFDAIAQYGEPGFLNEEAALKRRKDFKGLNPCAEILLADNGVCNLASVNLMAHVKNGNIDWDDLEKTIVAATRHSVRITLLELELPHWNEQQKRDRLLGVSIMGFGDYLDTITLDQSNPQNSNQNDLSSFLNKMRNVARQEANKYAFELRIPAPLLVTTVKPDGTCAQLPGVSSGVHPNFGPYYIRRVRISSVDAVAKALNMLGVYNEPDKNNFETLVFEFPVKTPATRYAYEYSAVEMLERYKTVLKDYAEHNVSQTIYFDQSEITEIVDWIYDNWDDYVAVSFLVKSDATYPQMPYERISEQTYEEMMAKMPKPEAFRAMLDAVEYNQMSATDDLEGCDTGACPVR